MSDFLESEEFEIVLCRSDEVIKEFIREKIAEHYEPKSLYKKMYDCLRSKNEELRQSCNTQSKRIKQDAEKIYNLELELEKLKLKGEKYG